MSIIITLLTILLVVVSLLLILLTLMQRPKQEGLGAAFGGGMMNDTFGAQTTDVLQKATVWLTVVFFGTAVLLTVLNSKQFSSRRDVGNVLEGVKPEPIPTLPNPGTTPGTNPLTIPSPDSSEATPKPAADKSGTEPAPKADANKPKAEEKTSKPAPAKPSADSSAPAKTGPGAKTDAEKNNKAAKSEKPDTPKPSAKEKNK